MPPNKSNYSKRPVRRVRLPKIGLRKTKSLFEEYFYAFLVTITVVVTILGKAGGLSGYDAIVTGLWAGGFTGVAWQVNHVKPPTPRPVTIAPKPRQPPALDRNSTRLNSRHSQNPH